MVSFVVRKGLLSEGLKTRELQDVTLFGAVRLIDGSADHLCT